MMEAISKENKGPKTLYEVSSLAEEDLANNKQEDRKEDINRINHPIKKEQQIIHQCRDYYVLQHGHTDLSITQEQSKSDEIGLMIKDARKEENNGSSMYNLRQESVS